MNPESALWRKYLRQDPTRFLFDADANPSVYLWYLIDLAHRPETSSVVIATRERVLFSLPVQEIFAAQRDDGHWGAANSLAEPYYQATLWNLALLAELGIPRDSRRARTACEFALENFLDREGRFVGLNLVESGYLIHALAYFRPPSDRRVSRAARGIVEFAHAANSVEESVLALWAWAGFRDDAEISVEVTGSRERLLSSLAGRGADGFSPIAFPPFDPRDAMFISRVLAIHDCANDPRAARLVDTVLGKQNEQSQWPLERKLNGSLTARSEEVTSASRWATLNALRVIVRIVDSGRD